jgi:DNA mismatch repair protein MutS2
VGDPVQVRSLGLNGEILAIDEEDETAEVQVGGFRVEVELNELRREKSGKSRDTAVESPTSRAAASTKSLPPMPEVSMDFDMRGWRAAEVPDKLDRYLNDAYLAGLPSVRIIHGKGSGTLRQVVRDMLGQHRLVKSFGGGGADGGEGVTVAQLTER